MRIDTFGAKLLEFISKPGESTDIGLGKACNGISCDNAKGLDMKECEAPESNKTFAGKELTERLPKITSEEFSACAAFIRFTLADFGLCLTIAVLTGGGSGRCLGFGHLLA